MNSPSYKMLLCMPFILIIIIIITIIIIIIIIIKEPHYM